MSFGITPATGFPPQASDEFPNYIQFQNQGTDLGLPNVDTVNFGRNLVASRGTGENANVVTVVAELNAALSSVCRAMVIVGEVPPGAASKFTTMFG